MTEKSITIPISEESARMLTKIAKEEGKDEIAWLTGAVEELIADNYMWDDDEEDAGTASKPLPNIDSNEWREKLQKMFKKE